MAIETYSVELALELQKFASAIQEATATLTQISERGASAAAAIQRAFETGGVSALEKVAQAAQEAANGLEKTSGPLQEAANGTEALGNAAREITQYERDLAESVLEGAAAAEKQSTAFALSIDGLKVIRELTQEAGEGYRGFQEDVRNAALAVSEGARAYKLQSDGLFQLEAMYKNVSLASLEAAAAQQQSINQISDAILKLVQEAGGIGPALATMSAEAQDAFQKFVSGAQLSEQELKALQQALGLIPPEIQALSNINLQSLAELFGQSAIQAQAFEEAVSALAPGVTATNAALQVFQAVLQGLNAEEAQQAQQLNATSAGLQQLRALYGADAAAALELAEGNRQWVQALTGVPTATAQIQSYSETVQKASKETNVFGSASAQLNTSLFLLDASLSRSLEILPGIGDAYRGVSAILFGLTPILSELAPAFNQIANQLLNANSSVNTFVGNTGELVGVLFAVQVAVEALVASQLNRLADFFTSIAQKTAESSGQLQLFQTIIVNALERANSVTGNTTGTIQEFNASIAELSNKFGAAQIDITKTTARFLELQPSLHLSGEQLRNLVAISTALGVQFRDQGRVMTDLADAFEKMPLPIRRLIGADVTLGSIQKEINRVMSEGGDEAARFAALTDENRKTQAVYNIVLAAAQPYLNAFEQSQFNAAIATNRLEAATTDLINRFGEFTGPQVSAFNNFLTTLVRGITGLPDGFFQVAAAVVTFGGAIAKIGAIVLEIGTALTVLTGGYIALQTVLTSEIPLLIAFRNSMGAVLTTLTGTAVELNSVGALFRAFGASLAAPFAALARFLIPFAGYAALILGVAAAVKYLADRMNEVPGPAQGATQVIEGQRTVFERFTESVANASAELGNFIVSGLSQLGSAAAQAGADLKTGLLGSDVQGNLAAFAQQIQATGVQFGQTADKNRELGEAMKGTTAEIQHQQDVLKLQQPTLEIIGKAYGDLAKVAVESEKQKSEAASRAADEQVLAFERTGATEQQVQVKSGEATLAKIATQLQAEKDRLTQTLPLFDQQLQAEKDAANAATEASSKKVGQQIQHLDQLTQKTLQAKQTELQAAQSTYDKELQAAQSLEEKSLGIVRKAQDEKFKIETDLSAKLFDLKLKGDFDLNAAILDKDTATALQNYEIQKRIDEDIAKARDLINQGQFEKAQTYIQQAEGLTDKLKANADESARSIADQQAKILTELAGLSEKAQESIAQTAQEQATKAQQTQEQVKTALEGVATQLQSVAQQIATQHIDVIAQFTPNEGPLREAIDRIKAEAVTVAVKLSAGEGATGVSDFVTKVNTDLQTAFGSTAPVKVPVQAPTVDIPGGSEHPFPEAGQVIVNLMTPQAPVNVQVAAVVDQANQAITTLTTTPVTGPTVNVVPDLTQVQAAITELQNTVITIPAQVKVANADIPGGSLHPLEEAGSTITDVIQSTMHPVLGAVKVDQADVAGKKVGIDAMGDEITKLAQQGLTPLEIAIKLAKVPDNVIQEAFNRAQERGLQYAINVGAGLALNLSESFGSALSRGFDAAFQAQFLSLAPFAARIQDYLNRNPFDLTFRTNLIDIPGGSLHPLDEFAEVVHRVMQPPPLEVNLTMGGVTIPGGGVRTLATASQAIRDILTPDAVQAQVQLTKVQMPTVPVIPPTAVSPPTGAIGTNAGLVNRIQVDIRMNDQVYPIMTADRQSAQSLVQFARQLQNTQQARGEYVSPYTG